MPRKNQKLVLFVNHNIFLTREERYSLVNRERVETTGVSVPVWMEYNTGKTTEPAEEVFCRYRLDNDKSRKPSVRGLRSDEGHGIGYWINIPQLPEDWKDLPPIDYNQLGEMSAEERKRFCELRDQWFKKNPQPPSGESLRDHKDKGGEYLRFEMKMSAKMNSQEVELSKLKILVSHSVEIKTLAKLEESMV